MIQLVDQVRIKLVSQWIKDISRTEKRLNQAKYYPNSVLRLICHENMQTNKYNNDFGFSNCKECTDSLNYKSSRPDVFCQKGVLRNFAKVTGKHMCQSLFFNKVAGGACNFIKIETMAQVFSCEFCEISKNTIFYRTPLVAASEIT